MNKEIDCNTILYDFFEKNYSKHINKFVKNGHPIQNNVIGITDNKHNVTFRPVKIGCKVSGAYIIRHIKTKKIYVGSTSDVNRRMCDHEWNLNNSKDNSSKKLLLDYIKDPSIQFYFILTNTREEAYDIEQWLLDRYWGINLLYNTSPTARSSLYMKHSDEVKNKHSLNRMGNKYCLGNKLTISHKNNISKSSLGRIKTPEECRNISMGLKGKIKTKEHVEKIRLVNLGKKRSLECKQKQSETCFKVPVIIDDIEYKSIKDAAIKLKTNSRSLRFRLSSPSFKNYNYKDPSRIKKDVKKLAKPVFIDNVAYNSIKEAVRKTNYSKEIIKGRIKSGKYPEWRYL